MHLYSSESQSYDYAKAKASLRSCILTQSMLGYHNLTPQQVLHV